MINGGSGLHGMTLHHPTVPSNKKTQPLAAHIVFSFLLEFYRSSQLTLQLIVMLLVPLAVSGLRFFTRISVKGVYTKLQTYIFVHALDINALLVLPDGRYCMVLVW